MKTETKLITAIVVAAALAFGSRLSGGDGSTGASPGAPASPTTWSGAGGGQVGTGSSDTGGTGSAGGTGGTGGTGSSGPSAGANDTDRGAQTPGSGSTASAKGSDRRERAGDAPVRISTDRDAGGQGRPLQGIEGTLGLNDAGCWVLQHPDDEHLVILPAGTEVIRDGEAFELEGYGTVDSGDLVGGDGWVIRARDYDPEFARACRVPGDADLIRVRRTTVVQRF